MQEPTQKYSSCRAPSTRIRSEAHQTSSSCVTHTSRPSLVRLARKGSSCSLCLQTRVAPVLQPWRRPRKTSLGLVLNRQAATPQLKEKKKPFSAYLEWSHNPSYCREGLLVPFLFLDPLAFSLPLPISFLCLSPKTACKAVKLATRGVSFVLILNDQACKLCSEMASLFLGAGVHSTELDHQVAAGVARKRLSRASGAVLLRGGCWSCSRARDCGGPSQGMLLCGYQPLGRQR